MAHCLIAKRVLEYIKGITNLGIQYKKEVGSPTLLSLTDNNLISDLVDKKNTSKFVFIIGTRTISRASMKQTMVALFTTKEEDIAATLCSC